MYNVLGSVSVQSAPVFQLLRKVGPLAARIESGRSPSLLGYGTVACDFFPHTVLPDKSIGVKDSLDAVFSANYSIISVRVGRDGGIIVVDTDFEIADLFAVHFIVGRSRLLGRLPKTIRHSNLTGNTRIRKSQIFMKSAVKKVIDSGEQPNTS